MKKYQFVGIVLFLTIFVVGYSFITELNQPLSANERTTENKVRSEQLQEDSSEGSIVTKEASEEGKSTVGLDTRNIKGSVASNFSSLITPATVFVGRTEPVTNMAELIAAVADPNVGTISVQNSFTSNSAHVMTVNRPILIQGNGHTITFGNPLLYFEFVEVATASSLRMENVTLNKVGTQPLMNSADISTSGNWTLELENVKGLATSNALRLVRLPQGKVHFTGGVNTFQRSSTTSSANFIQAKEVIASNSASVEINQTPNFSVFYSDNTVIAPKLIVREGATINVIVGPSGSAANTIDFRGPQPEISVQSGSTLDISSASSNTTPTNIANNVVALVGANPKVSVETNSTFSIKTSGSKRGIFMSGEAPTVSIKDSNFNITNASGERIQLNGNNASLEMTTSSLTMNATTGSGISITGSTPEVKLNNSKIIMEDSGSSKAISLTGTDALLSLGNKSLVSIVSGLGGTGNISVGNNSARPRVLISGESKLNIKTASVNNVEQFNVSNALHVYGSEPKMDILESELQIDVTVGYRLGFFMRGETPNLNIINSKVDVSTPRDLGMRVHGNNGKNQINNSRLNFTGETSGVVGLTGEAMETVITNQSKLISNQGIYFAGERLTINNDSEVNIKTNRNPNFVPMDDQQSSSYGLLVFERRAVTRGYMTVDNANISIEKIRATNSYQYSAPLVLAGGNNELLVENSGTVNLINEGNGEPSNLGNSGIMFFGYASGHAPVYPTVTFGNDLVVRDVGSRINVDAKFGTAVSVYNSTNSYMDGSLTVEKNGSFKAAARTETALGGAILGKKLQVTFDNPMVLELANNRPGGGQLFATTDTDSTLTGLNNEFSLWRKGDNFAENPYLHVKNLDYEFSGASFDKLVSTSKPDELNTSTIGTTGLLPYTRLGSDNARWAIADELRVPTNADKRIYGRVSVPIGLELDRPAQTDEATVTVEVERKNGDKEEYTTTTVGHTATSPGISIYGEAPRGGLFEIKLDDFLQEGDQVRIIHVGLTSGALTEGFENKILTETVEVFPIVPPTPAIFNSSTVVKTATALQGHTDNKDVEVTATHNGQPIDTTNVEVNGSGNFDISLAGLNLVIDDEIQVFLRDKEGSAETAGVVNPPVTNNSIGNINPKEELSFHDAKFVSATTLIVGEDSSILEVVFEDESGTVLPGYSLTIGEGQTIDMPLKVGDVINLKSPAFQEVQDQVTALETAGYEITSRPSNEAALLITEVEQTVVYKVTGQLFLKSAPKTVEFGSLTYNAKVQRVDNPKTDADLVVTDTRANKTEGWTLYAALTGNMTNTTTGSVMNEALWYVNNSGDEIPLTLDYGNQVVYKNATGGTFDVTSTWGTTSDEPGLKLIADPTKTTVSSVGTYAGVVTWTIMAGQP
ncbi:pectate lyase-like adhesive domain-containing protein [Enterococcus sp. 5H]|uniref:pectate lyase-like adhesive domain-containing protein n=1 Tax=Enterococcus sp. 5H TaxID=1229490 RepID=UPI0023026B18|nr:pectate lyase-like adhesive domain-containing protein [Enterococcus sp. 5H]MDA9472551.1 extracellular protein [Enterococcus sp. 5H]